MKSNILAIIDKFDELYQDPKCELIFHSEYELLVAVILSAQCTDKRVNLVTAELFKKYNTPQKMITLPQEELENIIRPCGFFRNKAKHILSASKEIVDKYDGRLPKDIEAIYQKCSFKKDDLMRQGDVEDKEFKKTKFLSTKYSLIALAVILILYVILKLNGY